MARTILSFNGNAVIIGEAYGMGEGVDGYTVETPEGHWIKEFHRPYTAAPEDEWRALSDLGKDGVRENGWIDWGEWTNAVTAGLRELGIEAGSAKRNELAGDARHQLERLLEGHGGTNGEGRLDELVDAHQELVKLIEVVENLDHKDADGFKHTWGHWPIPATN
jgi:hypothetical protein